ncbi:MAG: alpha/beta hydrolase [Bacteroidota bacterium]
MIVKSSFILALIFLSQFANAQKIETIYLSASDSTLNLYIVVYPPALPWKGYAFFIPGMFQKASDVLLQSDLPVYAAQQGILSIIPTFKTGIASFGFDTATQSSLLEHLKHVRANHKLDGLPFYLGGFSIGGTCAIKYAELAIKNNYPVKPAAVFAIDAPLDFEREYKNMLRETRLPNSSEDGLAESNYILNRAKKEFGGSPFENLAAYYQLSPYSYNDSTQLAIKPLVNLPIRLYTEPDILWWLGEGVDYSLMNAFDFAAMTNELKRMGSSKIELITTNNKGYRNPGHKRHPHSWSIVDPTDLVKWLLNQNK